MVAGTGGGGRRRGDRRGDLASWRFRPGGCDRCAGGIESGAGDWVDGGAAGRRIFGEYRLPGRGREVRAGARRRRGGGGDGGAPAGEPLDRAGFFAHADRAVSRPAQAPPPARAAGRKYFDRGDGGAGARAAVFRAQLSARGDGRAVARLFLGVPADLRRAVVCDDPAGRSRDGSGAQDVLRARGGLRGETLHLCLADLADSAAMEGGENEIAEKRGGRDRRGGRHIARARGLPIAVNGRAKTGSASG